MSIKHLNAQFHNDFKNKYFHQVYFCISRDILISTDMILRSERIPKQNLFHENLAINLSVS